MRRRAAGRQRGQPAAVDRVDAHVGLVGGVDRGAELRLVFRPGGLHGAREIDQRLALRVFAVFPGQRRQRGEPAVGVEQVELHVVRDKDLVGGGRVVVRLAVGGRRVGRHRVQLLQSLGKDDAVVRQVLHDLERAAVGGDGDQVVRSAAAAPRTSSAVVTDLARSSSPSDERSKNRIRSRLSASTCAAALRPGQGAQVDRAGVRRLRPAGQVPPRQPRPGCPRGRR